MGQKVNPRGMRLGITEEHTSKWYATSKDYARLLNEDLAVREFLMKRLSGAAIGRIQIDRPARNAKIAIHSARPGVIIGKKGNEVEVLRNKIVDKLKVPVHITIEEIRKPELCSKLVAENVAQQLERRVMFRRAMKRAIQTTIKHGALGIKISVSGRLGGAEIARTEWTREGRVPLHTFRADIDYNTAIAKTTYGIIGVKVWIFKGEIHEVKQKQANNVAASEAKESTEE
jgi:small subunit ribosomal protein S3